MKALPHSIEITLKMIHSILAHTNLGTIKKLADGNHIIGLELLRSIPDPQIPQCETCALSKMKTPTIRQRKMEALKYRTWIGMNIDTIGPFGMTTKAEAPSAVLTLINLVGAPKRIHSEKMGLDFQVGRHITIRLSTD